MNAVTHFDFKSSSVRIAYDENGEPLFCLADVCKVLNISRSSDLLQIQRGYVKNETPKRHGALDPIQIPIKPYGLDLTVQAVEQPNSTDVQRLLRNDKAEMSCLVTFPVLELAYNPIRRYSFLALSKISRLALTGYNSLAHIVRTGLFLCVISLCVCISMAKLERDTFECAGNLVDLSTNPFQLCHPHLVVTGKAPKQTQGAHSS